MIMSVKSYRRRAMSTQEDNDNSGDYFPGKKKPKKIKYDKFPRKPKAYKNPNGKRKRRRK